MPNERECYAGIVKRGLKEEWCGYLRTEYEFSTAVCRSLASDIEVFVNEVRGELKEGQLFYRAVKCEELTEGITEEPDSSVDQRSF
jgi:hypothetical protein